MISDKEKRIVQEDVTVIGLDAEETGWGLEPFDSWVGRLFGSWGDGHREQTWARLAWQALGAQGLVADGDGWDEQPVNASLLIALAAFNEGFQCVIGGGYGEMDEMPEPGFIDADLDLAVATYWAGSVGLAADAVEDGSTAEEVVLKALQEEAAARVSDVASALAAAWGTSELYASLRWASRPDDDLAEDGESPSDRAAAYSACLVSPEVDDHRAWEWLEGQLSPRRAPAGTAYRKVSSPREVLLALAE